jgi:hypothetical protein
MDKYYQSGNLIVRTDSYDKIISSKPPLKIKYTDKNTDTDTKPSTWKNITQGNTNEYKNLRMCNFPKLK